MDFLIKCIGIIFIIGATSLLGVRSSLKLKKRADTLSWFVSAVCEIRDKVRSTGAEIPKIVEGLYAADRYFTVEAPFKVCLKNGALTEKDQKLLNEFFAGFGMGDIASQISRSDMYLNLLQKEYEAAEGEYAEKSRLYKQLGFFAGLSIAVMVV